MRHKNDSNSSQSHYMEIELGIQPEQSNVKICAKNEFYYLLNYWLLMK